MTAAEDVVDELAPSPERDAPDGPARPDPEIRLALSLAQIARDLSAGPSVSDILARLVGHAVTTIEGCDAAGVTVARPGWFRTAAATDEIVCEVDEHQYSLREGPCVQALMDHEVFRTGDLASDPRWPTFGERAAELGINSMLSFRLFSEDDTFGSLNLYARPHDAFPERAVDVGAAFAAHAGLALAQAEDRDSARNLERALDSSRTVSMAIGILMATHRLDENASFELLRTTSQRLNRKLRDVADDVVRTGALQGVRAP